MSAIVVASVVTFASAPAVFVLLCASVLLLCLRAWAGTIGLVVSRRVAHLLDAAIGVLIVLLIAVVLARFATLA